MSDRNVVTVGALLLVGACVWGLSRGETSPAQASPFSRPSIEALAPDPVSTSFSTAKVVTCTSWLGCQIELKNMGFNPGPLDGVYGPQTRMAWDACYQAGRCSKLPSLPISSYGVYATPYAASSYSSYTPTPSYVSGGWAKTCPGGSCYGAISTANGRARTHYARG